MPEDTELLALLERFKKPKRQHIERNLLAKVHAAAPALGMRLWRNQVGSYRLANGRWITSGLSVGSADLIGYRRVVVTQEMVGKPSCIFTAIEVKSATGRLSRAQQDFLSLVRSAGGIADVVRSVHEFEEVVRLSSPKSQDK